MASLCVVGGVVAAVVLSGCQDPEEHDEIPSFHSMNASLERFLDNTPCTCPDMAVEVCGDDGVTYKNACFAACEGVVEHTAGACPEACECETSHHPVCGNNEETYDNPCLAECAGVEFTEGECEEQTNHPLPECVVDMYTSSEFQGSRHILSVTNECVGGVYTPDYTPYQQEACIYDAAEFPHNLAHDMRSVKTSGLCHRTILVDGDGCQLDHPENMVLQEVDSEFGKNLPLNTYVCKIVVILSSGPF